MGVALECRYVHLSSDNQVLNITGWPVTWFDDSLPFQKKRGSVNTHRTGPMNNVDVNALLIWEGEEEKQRSSLEALIRYPFTEWKDLAFEPGGPVKSSHAGS